MNVEKNRVFSKTGKNFHFENAQRLRSMYPLHFIFQKKFWKSSVAEVRVEVEEIIT